MKKRTLACVLLACMLASCSSVGNTDNTESNAVSSNENVTAEESIQVEETEETLAAPDLPSDIDFGGKTFTFGVVDNENARNPIVMEELTGEVLNDAQFNTIQETNEALNVKVAEYLMTSGYPASQDVINTVTAGDDVIQVANIFCAGIPSVLKGGYVLSYNDVPYLDLSNEWWDQKVNDALVIAGIRYAVNGDLNITTHDLTYALLFSKNQISDYQMESPYDLVTSGKWTMDKMSEYMVMVTRDADGDGEFTDQDNYGYASSTKMTLPSFWIGAGETTITLNEEEIPTPSMDDERFNDVIQKIFAITYDTGVRYKNTNENDVPSDVITLFESNRVLFMDCSLYHIGIMRDSDTDFGIIPYPKYDETQESYCARVSYFMPSVMPSTNKDLELIGAVLEYANYRAKINITPAYYDITLKGKVSRDAESVDMLDLLLANRVVDLGDTLFCASVRDGFFTDMYRNDNRNLASTLKTRNKILNKEIEKMVSGLTESAQ